MGEIFPFISQDGQEKAIRQILELCPWSKILWSTDGKKYEPTRWPAYSTLTTTYLQVTGSLRLIF